jgi:hypothetical protein
MAAADSPEPVGRTEAIRAPSATSRQDSPPRRAQFVVMVGLLVTFGGLFGYALQLPTEPSALDDVVPWLAAGFLTVWTGGILAGNSLVPLPSGVRPIMIGQPAVAGFSTVAGALSALVVVVRVGPWIVPAPGTPEELVIAVVAATIVWVGGFLMGRSMRRFARRHRTPRSGRA